MQISAELSNFVREALNIGRRPETIHADLGASGWTELEIEAALAHWAYVDGVGAVPRPYRSTAAWDALFYALLFAAFGFLIGHVLHLMLGILTVLLPEPDDSFSAGGLDGLRWSMAAALIFGPAFVALHVKDAKACAQNPVRRHGTIRRWLATFAIFVAAIALMCDAIYVMYSYLTGDVKFRFIAKSAAVALMSCVVLIYFRQDRQATQSTSIGAWLAAALSIVTLGFSFWLVGGPAQGKAELRDRLRLSDLNELLWDVANCRALRGQPLPDTLDPLMCAQNPEDLTGLAGDVVYKRLSDKKFELCVSLEAPDRAGQSRNSRRDGDAICRSTDLD